MHVEFRKCGIPQEIRALRAFDRKVFRKTDLFTSDEWNKYASYWMIVERTAVGYCAFQLNVDFQEDIREDEANQYLKGSLYISTNIHNRYTAAFSAQGIGAAAEVLGAYNAKYHAFTRIVTNTRKHNRRMISLNQKFGFQIIRTTRGYYSHPAGSTVVTELKL